MFVTLSIIRYPGWSTPFGLLSMAFFRLPMMLNQAIHFYKLMGTGKNGSFDKVPDLQQWTILSGRDEEPVSLTAADLYGPFITKWLKLFNCEVYTVLLYPLESHGAWNKKAIFGTLPRQQSWEGPLAVLTRAAIRPSKLREFWKNVPYAAAAVLRAPGLVFSVGMGETPWIHQATFSVWTSMEAMKAYAYGEKDHSDVIRKTRQQDWYSEELFARFRIMGRTGTFKGKDPLENVERLRG